jgi:hypothetical protein
MPKPVVVGRVARSLRRLHVVTAGVSIVSVREGAEIEGLQYETLQDVGTLVVDALSGVTLVSVVIVALAETRLLVNTCLVQTACYHVDTLLIPTQS